MTTSCAKYANENYGSVAAYCQHDVGCSFGGPSCSYCDSGLNTCKSNCSSSSDCSTTASNTYTSTYNSCMSTPANYSCG